VSEDDKATEERLAFPSLCSVALPRRDRGLLLLDRANPREADWHNYLNWCERNISQQLKNYTLVITAGGHPNVRQRALLSRFIEQWIGRGFETRTTVIHGDTRFAAMIVTRFMRLGGMPVLGPREYSQIAADFGYGASELQSIAARHCPAEFRALKDVIAQLA
jgi:hypothetical protein